MLPLQAQEASKMKLIADSGATGTDWALIKGGEACLVFRTKGLNVNYLTEREIEESIRQEVLPPLLSHHPENIEDIFFFGAGCSHPDKQRMMGGLLKAISRNARIFPDHDMLGAAISLCGDGTGLVSILGTGSNTCFYDEKTVKKNILSLGYVFGDEGSGTYMGMHLLKNYLTGDFPADLEQLFQDKYPKQKYELVSEMYAAPKMGAYFSSYSYFIAENRRHEYIQTLIKDAFRAYFRRQVLQFRDEYKRYPLGAVGSIAYLFEDELRTVAAEFGVTIGSVLRNPIEGLIKYYCQHE
ncbi:MAG: ATPase [Bacteroidales bacterium]|nr:ATPase [Bacteroidales bacterium]